jgi:predicted signal transduction protein with EAL and GGDEF domain
VVFAQSLGLPTVAEGVEHRTELDVLRDLGCSGFQGYFFAKPMNATAVIGLLAEARGSSKVYVKTADGSPVAALTRPTDVAVAGGSTAHA